jgi:meso-butanediol dehydrogenase/(S,S)-butanediol dehydrogenase/diacetyl reductase
MNQDNQASHDRAASARRRDHGRVHGLVAANREHAPLGKLVQPDDVAKAVLFLAGEGASAITGHVLVIDAGVSLVGYAHALPAGT